jgi:single-stranded-DNA-specific exonuclease
VVGGESLGHDVAEQLERLAPFGIGNPGVRLLVPSARVCDVRPMGEGDKHARFRLESGQRSALGVAFGVNGELSGAELVDHLDVSLKLELNEWNGAISPRVVLGELYGGEPEVAPSRLRHPGSEEWWRRLDAEREAALDRWPPPELVEAAHAEPRREVADRRGASGVATVAALASSGATVLVLCADALRRRELVERAAAPARFGGGGVAIASGRLADDAVRGAVEAVAAAGSGLALADWPALARMPDMRDGFEHVVVIDPPPFSHLDRIAAAGTGFVHLAWDAPGVELALHVHDEEWPNRAALIALYRTLGVAGDGEAALRDALVGPGRHPRSPEVAGRRLRVLEDLGAIHWEPSRTARSVRVVSSEEKDLERLSCFVAYRARSEEGKRFLSGQRQPR